MIKKWLSTLCASALSVSLLLMPPIAMAQELNRNVLPIAEPSYQPITELDVRKSKAPPLFDPKAPKGAPNVVLVLLDDMGFGQPSTFGGGINTPTLDMLAAGGLRYINLHTAALCSPTRAALLTGRNHHSNNTGAVQDVATSFPGNTGKRPNSIAPLAEILRLNGYNTGAFGKWHLTPLWETTNSGPFTLWPTYSGFQKFYGFLGGEANQWAPLLYDGTYKVEIPDDPKYYLTTDLANQAIGWMQSQHSLTPDKPFFMYFAPGATHRRIMSDRNGPASIRASSTAVGINIARKPWHARSSLASFRRERNSHRNRLQSRIGIRLMPKKRNSSRGRWRFLRPLANRSITRSAGWCSNLKTSASMTIHCSSTSPATTEPAPKEQMAGMYNEMSFFNSVPETVADQVAKLDKWGGPETFPHFAAGWAVAGNTPYAYAKQVASDGGGTADGMVITWPKGFSDKGAIRGQYHHVIDIAPTVLEAAGLPVPVSVNGTTQRPMEGTSLFYTFGDAKAKDRHTVQYYEIFGNRAIYNDGWLARTIHRAPWEPTPRAPLAADKWELFDRNTDYSFSKDVAAKYPEKLRELQALFLSEGAKYNVLPIDDRMMERFIPALAGRPDLMAGRRSLSLFPGMTGIGENAFINVKNVSHTITAEVEIPSGGARRRCDRTGGAFRRLVLVFQWRQAGIRVQLDRSQVNDH